MRAWALWDMPVRVVVLVLLAEIVAVALIITLFVANPLPGARHLFFAALILGLAIGHTELTIRIERTRRRVGGAVHVELVSVWIFAGALILPPAVAALTAIAIGLIYWMRTRPLRVPIYRSVYSRTTATLACIAASAVMAAVGHGELTAHPADFVALWLAMLAYLAVNTGMVGAAIALSVPKPTWAKALGDRDDNFLDFATLALGGLAAAAIVLHPLLSLFMLPPLVVLHRAVLVRQLREAAATDGKTGLLNAVAWHSQAERALERASGVLVLDLDHFKAVNDAHGHLAGDRVLVAIAGILRSEVREGDLVGRFGGEEFVVLLAGGDPAAVAERIRGRVAELQVEIPTPDGPLSIGGLSISVGCALHPGGGSDVTTLLHIADAALYAAKRAGRNAVRTGSSEAVAPLEAPHIAGETPLNRR